MPRRPPPTPLEHVVDGSALRARLSAAALEAFGDEGRQRGPAIDILKETLDRGRAVAKARLESGAGGVETARLLCGITDEIVGALYDFTTVHVFRASNPTQGERITLMAVGGYGRGALAPFSDIDLLFVRPYKETAHTESVIEFMLYALWDLGFKVGHASRTVADCVKLARADMTIRTSLLESRLLTGDEALARSLKRRFRDEVVKGTGAAFVTAKLKERDARHARAGASRFLVEPNVKEGKGGLRDLHTLFWIARYLHPADDLEVIPRLTMFGAREVRAFMGAFDFLEAVRAHLHFVAGRAEERLTFDLQPEVARRMGYRDRPKAGGDNTPAVERFMRRYFLVAGQVGALTRVFAAKLEAENMKAAPRGLSRFLPGRSRRRVRAEPGFQVEGGRLTITGPETFEGDPVNLLRLFHIADARDLDLHPDAFTAATRRLGLITSAVRRDPVAAAVFLDILARGRETRRTLELMNEAGVLGRFIPEFGHIVGRTQFNRYHSYTVDEHSLRAVGIIADIAAGRLAPDHPLSTAVMPLIDDSEALFLAMLLHDTGKGGAGGQEKAGARTARQACERLGLAPARVDLVAWLVEHHLMMSDCAQKRDIGDPATVAAFAAAVGTSERLRQLLVLTVADIRAVGPGVWNGWKGQLLAQLHEAAETILRGGGALDAAGAAHRRQGAVAQAARQALVAADPGAEGWAGAMEDAYFTAFSLDDQTAHLALSRRAEMSGAAAEARILAGRNVTQVVVAAPDRPALFADLALAIAALGGDVVGARIFTSRTGVALDVFFVQGAAREPLGEGDPPALARLTGALADACRGERTRREPRRHPAFARPSPFTLSPSVTIDNDASRGATVIEASGRDRPGLLEALARALAEGRLSIQSAHIDSLGERAVDTFYVVGEDGGKLTDEARAGALRARLIAVLEAAESPPARPGLSKARASAVR
ncbi:MAG: [protein-PII] uridylyltransferase [Caulobacteraceae bacterium]